MSLPFTYLNTREQVKFPPTDHSISPKAPGAKVIENQQEVYPRPLRSLLCSQPAPNRQIEFRKF